VGCRLGIPFRNAVDDALAEPEPETLGATKKDLAP
jgi:hypothetical protein